MTMQANPHDLARSRREGKAAAGSSQYPNFYAPRANTEEFLNGLRRQVKFEIGVWPDILKIHEICPDIAAAVWCLMRETLVVCDKVPRSMKEVAAFYAAHLNDCQVLQDGHSQLLRVSLVDGDKVEKIILEGRDLDQEGQQQLRKPSSPRFQLPAGVDTLLGWMLAVHRGNFARMKVLPFTLQAAPELISVVLCQYFLSRVAAMYIPKRSGLFKLVQSTKHILPTDVYMRRIEVPLGESTHPIHRFSFDAMAASLPAEFAFAAPAAHIAQALTLWSVVMKRSCAEYISERTMAALDQIIEIAGGLPDLSQPQVATEISRRIEEQLPALREKTSAVFIIHLVCSRTLVVDRKELVRFERLWTKSEQKERVFGAVVYAAYLHVRELARLISSAVAPEPKILFRDLMTPMSPPSAVASPVPLLRQSPPRRGSVEAALIPMESVATSGNGERASRLSGSRLSASVSAATTSPRSPRRLMKERDGSPMRLSGSVVIHSIPSSASAPAAASSPAVPLLPDSTHSPSTSGTPSRRASGAMMRTVSLSQIEGLDKLDASGHTKPLSLWDKADVQQWLISIGSKRHQKRFMEADIEGMDMMVLTQEKLEALGVRRKEERDVMLRSLAMMPSAAESSGVSPANNRSLRGNTKNDRIHTTVSQIFSPQSSRTDGIAPPAADSPSTHHLARTVPDSASGNPPKTSDLTSASLHKSPEHPSRPRKERANPRSPSHRTASPSRSRTSSTPVPKTDTG